MDETKRSLNFTAKRIQAIHNMESHIQKILFPKAKAIITASAKFIRGKKLGNEASFLSEARSIAATAERDIERYVSAYSTASCKLLGISDGDISSFVTGNIYGKTTRQRLAAYLDNFAEDIVRIVKAGTLMDYSDSQILSAVRTGYKNPYRSSVVTKAQRKDINIATPSYGKGYYRNAYENIVRTATQVISLSWGRAEQQYGKDSGAIGFKVYRGSSYPCPICDDECSYVHKLSDPFPPFHLNCVCGVKFIFKEQ